VTLLEERFHVKQCPDHNLLSGWLHDQPPLDDEAFAAARAVFGTERTEQDARLYRTILAYLEKARFHEIRAALDEANGLCRSAWQVSNRISTEYSTQELGTNFDALADNLYKSLLRQHEVILSTGGYQTSAQIKSSLERQP